MEGPLEAHLVLHKRSIIGPASSFDGVLAIAEFGFLQRTVAAKCLRLITLCYSTSSSHQFHQNGIKPRDISSFMCHRLRSNSSYILDRTSGKGSTKEYLSSQSNLFRDVVYFLRNLNKDRWGFNKHFNLVTIDAVELFKVFPGRWICQAYARK
ncbi:hypothetical protein NE237_007048 [Protea cynaroides]|uniref:Uncharacterized protein n=1 Tax=Protea cynaroides TaxID=273540 RepID=A0A9Q0QW35_9MAGN|nr:hypothetical protein NE237_007048 [Protea cynaroides]